VSGEQTIKLTAYFGERARAGNRLLADELLDSCARRAVRLSVLLRGIQGFGARQRLRSDRLLTLSEDLPLVSIAIDTRERIEALSDDLAGLAGDGLVTLERALLAEQRAPARRADAGERANGGESAQAGESTQASGGGQLGPRGSGVALPAAAEIKLTVCLGRHERVDGEPAFAAVCRVLRDAGVSGATVLLGVDGTVGGERRRARFFARNVGVPVLVLSVGQAESIERALAALARMLPSSLYITERVSVCRRDGELLRAPSEETPAGVESELAKLTVIVSEAYRHAGRPVYLELVSRLRAEGAAGATSLRGIWGFHGEHPPHGDRLLSLRRHVPVVTEVVDSPARIAALFAIADELTAERGLITSEPVPAGAPLGARPAL
jgi:PII-like signaling protein